jgi:hypothetical protein
MTVHEQGPSTSSSVIFDTSHGFFVLTSSEGDGLEFTREVHFVSESLEIGNWIGTRRKYENQWSGG